MFADSILVCIGAVVIRSCSYKIQPIPFWSAFRVGANDERLDPNLHPSQKKYPLEVRIIPSPDKPRGSTIVHLMHSSRHLLENVKCSALD